MRKKRYLVGIGNYTQTDDGIGLRVAEYIVQQKLARGFEVLDIGDNGLHLLSYFEDAEYMLWVDCVRMGLKAGEFVFFSPDDVESRKRLAGRTTHEGDMLQVIELARKMGYSIPKIDICGIEPGSTEQGWVLTGTLQLRFPEYIDAVLARMK